MDISIAVSGRTLNIAHRGASSTFPENTMAAFRAAVAMNADMIELDVQMSKDNVPVVIHDATLSRLSGEKGFVKDYTSKELIEIDIKLLPDVGSEGTRIPLLDDVLKFLCGKALLNIEIKTEAVTDRVEDGVEYQCLQLLEKYNIQEQTLISSFDMRAVRHVKQINPTIAVAVLYSGQQHRGQLPSQIVQHYNADTFHCAYHQLNQKWLKDLKDNRIPVLVYTVNQEAKMRKLIDGGVNGIITDKPDLLNKIINQ